MEPIIRVVLNMIILAVAFYAAQTFAPNNGWQANLASSLIGTVIGYLIYSTWLA